jgi:hypothetical protein
MKRDDGGIFSTLSMPYWGLVGVGVLSGWYHMTLNYHSQMGTVSSSLVPQPKECFFIVSLLAAILSLFLYAHNPSTYLVRTFGHPVSLPSSV